jgi:HAE1 family hydrophobic/amphiphilic exporter-1
MPQAEYLPTGNRNFLFGMVLPPPGYNLEEVAGLREFYTAGLRRLWETPPEQAGDLPGAGVDNFFYVSLNNMAFMGARSRDPLRVRELLPEFHRVNQRIPGAIAFVNPASLFARGIGQGRNIDIEVSGPELTHLIQLGGQIFGQVLQELPGAQARPIPSLDLGNPEVRVRTDRLRAAELGVSNRDLGLMVSALVDGAKVSDYRHEGREIDLKLMARRDGAHRTHLLEQLPIATPAGRVVTLGSVARVGVVDGPVTIRHRERERSIAIQVTPPETVPLQAAMESIEERVLGPMRQAGQLGGLYRTTLSGSADKLTQTGRALMWNFLLAVVITYLLMAALFENFLHPFVILFSVPLGAVGGLLGLSLVNRLLAYQALDVLTMLGFVILVGTVVNNAILIVHQSLNHMRFDGMAPRPAIREATRNRVRPIFMSVLTSVSGMLPLILFPGAGSELYRGLGSVVVGGLLVSTVFTLFLVPALFSLVLDARALLARRLGPLVPALGAKDGSSEA